MSIKKVNNKQQSLKNNTFEVNISSRPHKIEPFLPCPCERTINFEKPEFFYTKKCGRPHLKNPLPHFCKMPALGQTPSPDSGRLLWTAPK